MSQHLGMLYRAGVLARRRNGAQIHYRIDNAQVRRLCAALQPQLVGGATQAAAGLGPHQVNQPQEQA
jgi:hypothetical protein